ncbi:hypothetical protein NDU88_002401 [Pleurodeles waltl]|uniref:Uncharacterized protein n=1 Tax=Pleurodeles waltl TaxID=8319 RepID=A0AAV7TKM8_PLEWA|nr:hypothetical protein NDU88_002401 [Pleurodeles waltl]
MPTHPLPASRLFLSAGRARFILSGARSGVKQRALVAMLREAKGEHMFAPRGTLAEVRLEEAENTMV